MSRDAAGPAPVADSTAVCMHGASVTMLNSLAASPPFTCERPMSPDSPQSPDNPYAPPLARVDDVVPADEGHQLAGRLTRLWASLIDALVQCVIGLPIIYLLWGFRNDPGLRDSALNGLLGLVVFVAVNGVLLARHGQTVGKRLLKIRIVRGHGEPASLARLLVRRYLPVAIVSSIPLVGGLLAIINVLFIFRESRKCLHDSIADTIVIKA